MTYLIFGSGRVPRQDASTDHQKGSYRKFSVGPENALVEKWISTKDLSGRVTAIPSPDDGKAKVETLIDDHAIYATRRVQQGKDGERRAREYIIIAPVDIRKISDIQLENIKSEIQKLSELDSESLYSDASRKKNANLQDIENIYQDRLKSWLEIVNKHNLPRIPDAEIKMEIHHVEKPWWRRPMILSAGGASITVGLFGFFIAMNTSFAGICLGNSDTSPDLMPVVKPTDVEQLSVELYAACAEPSSNADDLVHTDLIANFKDDPQFMEFVAAGFLQPVDSSRFDPFQTNWSQLDPEIRTALLPEVGIAEVCNARSRIEKKRSLFRDLIDAAERLSSLPTDPRPTDPVHKLFIELSEAKNRGELQQEAALAREGWIENVREPRFSWADKVLLETSIMKVYSLISSHLDIVPTEVPNTKVFSNADILEAVQHIASHSQDYERLISHFQGTWSDRETIQDIFDFSAALRALINCDSGCPISQ